VVAEIPGPYLIEGIAHDGRRLYLGSIARGCIFTLEHGRAKVLGVGPLHGVFGMAFGGSRLWAATAELAIDDRTELVGIDLQRGRIASRYAPPSGVEEASLGDVTTGPAGDVFVSDSKGSVLRLSREAGRLEVLVARGKLRSPQGMVVDGSSLIVADYATGLHRVDLATGSVTAMEGGAIRGVDGLVRHGADLIAIQNGGSRPRVIRIPIARPAEAEILVEGGVLIEPSLGTVVGDRLLFIGRSQWGEANEVGEVQPIGAGPTRIMSLNLV
jgi:hypothetical protein